MLISPVAHQHAVRSLQAAMRARAHGEVQLAKPTSNLFRDRSRTRAGLEVGDLTGVIAIDAQARTADVQGMCTYDTLVATTLAHGLMPMVVPQLRTITLGGAVTGLGIESSSLFNGLPHESVRELDVVLASGELVTASTTENAELFRAFPNSYGSLGYAVRLRIALQPVQPYVALRHVRFDDLDRLTAAIASVADTGEWAGEPVDFVDGVLFSTHESYLTLARWSPTGDPSDYTGRQIFYRSIQHRERDCLTIADYLWRWDTDWFWCSAAFGLQRPWLRRLWPRRWRRSDVYHHLVALDGRLALTTRIARLRRQAARERVVQDVEVPLDRTAEFLRWFAADVAMTPVWLCPLRSRDAWPLYPLHPGEIYVNVGFWGTVPIAADARDGDVNRAIEQRVGMLGGHKSLYSDAYYDRDTFHELYGGSAYDSARDRYDPEGRLTAMYDKVVRR